MSLWKLPSSRRQSTLINRSIGAISESVCPLSLGPETEDFQMRSDHEAIGCAGVYQEETFPETAGFFRIPFGHRYTGCAHFMTSKLSSETSFSRRRRKGPSRRAVRFSG